MFTKVSPAESHIDHSNKPSQLLYQMLAVNDFCTCFLEFIRVNQKRLSFSVLTDLQLWSSHRSPRAPRLSCCSAWPRSPTLPAAPSAPPG